MRSITIKKQEVIITERKLSLPKIIDFCTHYGDDDEICDLLDCECNNLDCKDCLFHKENFEHFKAFINDEKIIQK